MSFSFAPPSPRRRPSLTPMIDVVFLLLVFFMLAARFGQDAELPLATGGAGSTPWQGPPRLLDIAPDSLRLNGQPLDPDAVLRTLASLTEVDSDPILLRPDPETDTQRLIDTMALLRSSGFTSLILVAP